MWEEGKFNVCLKGQGKNLHNIEGKKPVQIHVHVEKKKKDNSSPLCFQTLLLLTLHIGSEGSC